MVRVPRRHDNDKGKVIDCDQKLILLKLKWPLMTKSLIYLTVYNYLNGGSNSQVKSSRLLKFPGCSNSQVAQIPWWLKITVAQVPLWLKFPVAQFHGCSSSLWLNSTGGSSSLWLKFHIAQVPCGSFSRLLKFKVAQFHGCSSSKLLNFLWLNFSRSR